MRGLRNDKGYHLSSLVLTEVFIVLSHGVWSHELLVWSVERIKVVQSRHALEVTGACPSRLPANTPIHSEHDSHD